MALLDTDPASAPLTSENRRYQRVKVDLLGRYMLEDRREFPCQVINMSPGGLALIAPACASASAWSPMSTTSAGSKG
jgi:hypothetical protein